MKDRLVELCKNQLPALTGERYTAVVVACLCCLDESEANASQDEKSLQDCDRIVVGVRYIENCKRWLQLSFNAKIDNYNHTYSEALLGVVPIRTKPHTLVEVGDSDGTITVKSHKPQCRWTGCGQTCSEGFSPVKQSDCWRKTGELMLDGTQCDGHGTQTLCCPNEDIPKCSRYSWNNSNCDGTCPDGMFEIESHTKGCNRWHQSACCERGEATTELYDVLEWEPSLYCDEGSCPVPLDGKKTEVLVESNKGRGGRACLGEFIEWDLSMPVFQTT
ncbi:hypothetical protein BDW71DRAFT_212415 [Aspergillus fruticulosus]